MHNTTGNRILYVLLLIATLSTFFGPHYLIDMPHGQITDLLESPISAYGSGVTLHSEYGLLYTQLNRLAASVVSTFPDTLHRFDIPLLRAAFIALALGFSCWSINRSEQRIAPCITLLAISCVLQPHALFTVQDFSEITWHNMANNQMLGLLICLLSLIWRAKRPLGRIWCILVCCSGLHFMPNFSLAVSGLILFALVNTHPHSLYALCTVSFGVIIMSIGASTTLALPIVMPVLSIPTGAILFGAGTTIILYSVGQLLLHHSTLLPLPGDKAPLQTITHQLYDHLTQPIHGVITIVLLTLVVTQTLTPISAVALVLIVEILSSTTLPNLRPIIVAIVMGIVLYHVLVLTRITAYKFYHPTPNRHDQIVTLKSTHIPPETVVLHKYVGYRYFQDLFQLTDNPSANDFYQRLSYDYNRKQARWRIPFYNQEYIDMVNEAVAYFQQWPLVFKTQVVMLGPINPLPVLLHTAMPKNSYLSLSASQSMDRQLTPLYQEADFIYLPLFALPQTPTIGEQTDRNCHFYQWNYKHNRFHLVHVTPYGCIFATDKIMAQHRIAAIPAHAASHINTTCQQRHA